MTNPNPDPNPSSSPSPKRGLGHRLFLWGLLGGGFLFLLMALFLISITLPNLREVPPPEISGPHQVVQSQKPLNSPTSPTSQTLTVDASGKPGIPRLDDFSHLSPPMRELVRTWIARCEETNQALDTIPDPTLRAQVIAFLTNGRENLRKFLNCPLEWGKLPYEEAYEHATEYLAQPLYNSEWPSGNLKEIRTIYSKEGRTADSLSRRTSLEFFAYNHQWNVAVRTPIDDSLLSLWCQEAGYEYPESSTWNEEVYSWRQMGGRGLVGLTARSCQRALRNTQLKNRHPRLYGALDSVTTIPIGIILQMDPGKTELGENRKDPYPLN
jgi:hypothetical protein